MNMVEDFQRMTEQFTADHRNRIGTIKGIFRDTHATLGKFHQEHMQMRAELHRFLSNFMKEHHMTFKGLKAEMQKFFRGIQAEVNGLMRSFRAQDNERRMEAKRNHTAGQAFLRVVAQARRMRPLHGGGAEATPAPKTTRERKRRRKQAAA